MSHSEHVLKGKLDRAEKEYRTSERARPGFPAACITIPWNNSCLEAEHLLLVDFCLKDMAVLHKSFFCKCNNLRWRIYLHKSFSKEDIALGYWGNSYKFGLQNWKKYACFVSIEVPSVLGEMVHNLLRHAEATLLWTSKDGLHGLVRRELRLVLRVLKCMNVSTNARRNILRYHLQTLLLDVGPQLLHRLSPSHLLKK